jgi:hypothetical protein
MCEGLSSPLLHGVLFCFGFHGDCLLFVDEPPIDDGFSLFAASCALRWLIIASVTSDVSFSGLPSGR